MNPCDSCIANCCDFGTCAQDGGHRDGAHWRHRCQRASRREHGGAGGSPPGAPVGAPSRCRPAFAKAPLYAGMAASRVPVGAGPHAGGVKAPLCAGMAASRVPVGAGPHAGGVKAPLRAGMAASRAPVGAGPHAGGAAGAWLGRGFPRCGCRGRTWRAQRVVAASPGSVATPAAAGGARGGPRCPPTEC